MKRPLIYIEGIIYSGQLIYQCASLVRGNWNTWKKPMQLQGECENSKQTVTKLEIEPGTNTDAAALLDVSLCCFTLEPVTAARTIYHYVYRM